MWTEGIPEWGPKRWNVLLQYCVCFCSSSSGCWNLFCSSVSSSFFASLLHCFVRFWLRHFCVCFAHIVHTRRKEIVYWYWFYRACFVVLFLLYSLFDISHMIYFSLIYICLSTPQFITCHIGLLFTSFVCLLLVWYSLFIVRSLSLPLVFVCISVEIYCPFHFWFLF